MTAIFKKKKYWIIGGVSALVLALLAFFIWTLTPLHWNTPEGLENHRTLDEMVNHAEFIGYGTVTEVGPPRYLLEDIDSPYGWTVPNNVHIEQLIKGDSSITNFIYEQGYHQQGKEFYCMYPEYVTGIPLKKGEQVIIFSPEPGGFCVVRNGIVHINEWITKTDDIPDNLQMPLEDFLALIDSKL